MSRQSTRESCRCSLLSLLHPSSPLTVPPANPLPPFFFPCFCCCCCHRHLAPATLALLRSSCSLLLQGKEDQTRESRRESGDRQLMLLLLLLRERERERACMRVTSRRRVAQTVSALLFAVRVFVSLLHVLSLCPSSSRCTSAAALSLTA